MSIRISYAKPNPIGKDKTPYGDPKAEQLLGEWVDITNIGTMGIPISSITLVHTRFDDQCRLRPEPTERYWSGSGDGVLRAGQTLRVHTGQKRDEALLSSRPIDRGSVAWRAFANLDRFVLNNRCGDVLYVTWSNGYNDKATYANNPPEGVVLKRAGDRLVPVTGY